MPPKMRKVKKLPPKLEQVIDPALKPYRIDQKSLRFRNIEYDPEDDCIHRMLLDVDFPKNEIDLPDSLKERLKMDKSADAMETYSVFFSLVNICYS